MDEYLAIIKMFAGNFAPRTFMFCQGQILSIAQNTALFSLLGTTFGGNGTTTFALPDFRGRVPVGVGQGPGLPSIDLGQMAGAPTHTLITTEMPAHNHTAVVSATTMAVSNKEADSHTAAADASKVLAAPVDNAGLTSLGYVTDASPASRLNVAATTASIGIAGASQPHNNMQPYLGINFLITTEGLYPSRN
jgi:microcystin-dependent protein